MRLNDLTSDAIIETRNSCENLSIFLELRFFEKFENETDKSEIHFILFACRVDLFSFFHFLFCKILELTKKQN